MHAQLRHLITLVVENEHIEIRVLPYKAGAHPALGGPFTTLTFASPRLPQLAWHETMSTQTFVDRHQQVREYTVALAESARMALGPGESLDLIREVAKELK